MSDVSKLQSPIKHYICGGHAFDDKAKESMPAIMKLIEKYCPVTIADNIVFTSSAGGRLSNQEAVLIKELYDHNIDGRVVVFWFTRGNLNDPLPSLVDV